MHFHNIIGLYAAFLANLCSISYAAQCNPLKKSCPPNPALGSALSMDFTKGLSPDFSNQVDRGTYDYSPENGLTLTINKRLDNPNIKSNFYIMYGKAEVVFKAASGVGIISAFMMQSDDGDEIDFEWVGGDDTSVQTNFFSKGDVTTYDRGGFSEVSLPQAQYHTYTIDWGMDKLVWSIDGVPVRTLLNSTASGYPQSPQAVFLGIWASGDPDNSPDTIKWGGGETDYSQLPFSLFAKSLTVEDYSTGKAYKYTDQSGSWQSIEAIDGQVYGRINGDVPSSESSSSTSSSSADPSSATSSSVTSSSTSSKSSKSSTSSSSTSSSSTSSSSSSTTSSSTSSKSSKSSTSSSSTSSKSSESSSSSSKSTSSKNSAPIVTSSATPSSSITKSSALSTTSQTSKTSKSTTTSESASALSLSSTSNPSSPTSSNHGASSDVIPSKSIGAGEIVSTYNPVLGLIPILFALFA